MKSVFDFVKKKIPKLSSTELIALNSGNTSIDRQFQGIHFPINLNFINF